MIADYAEIVKEAGKLYSPACVANYIYDLVKEYNQFYHDFSILREENPELKNFRLVLSANVAKIVKSGYGFIRHRGSGKNVTIEDEHKRENKKGSPSISTK